MTEARRESFGVTEEGAAGVGGREGMKNAGRAQTVALMGC